jgi:VanZ family protein
MNRFIRSFWPALAWAIVITYLSVVPGDNLTLPPFEYADKLAHSGVYYLLSMLIIAGISRQWDSGLRLGRAVFIAILISIVLGGVLELIQQNMLSTRSGDVLDFVANTLGSFLAGLTHYVFKPFGKLLKDLK